MNRQYAEKIISALKDDLENDYNGFELTDDMSRAEKLFGKELPAIVDCTEEARSYGGTIRRNAQSMSRWMMYRRLLMTAPQTT